MAQRSGEIEAALYTSASVTLDSNGNGTVTFGVDNAWQRWEIDDVTVSTNQDPTVSPYPTATIYAGVISPRFSQGSSWTGNQDSFTGVAGIDDGGDLYVVWAGGIPGTIATAVVTGKRYTRRA